MIQKFFTVRALPALALVFGLFPMVVVAGPREDAAVQAAEAWLLLVDEGQYAASWKATAPLFQKQVAEKAWEKMAAAVREPLGALRSRKLASAVLTHALPGAPDGEYVVIQFQSSFANKAEAVETVTPMLDGEVWKVSGYFIR